MTQRTSAIAAAAFLILGAVIGTHMLAGAAPTGTPPPVSAVTVTSGSVEVTSVPPVDIGSSVRLDVNASTAPGTYLAVAGSSAGARLDVEVPSGVTVNGTTNVAFPSVPTVALENGTIVNLGTSSLNSITNATTKGNCTYANGAPAGTTIDTTAANIPASPLASRTAITIWNLEANRRLWCSAAGTASASSAISLMEDGGWHKWEGLGAGVLISCRCATSTCEYTYEEERCYQ